MKNFLLPLVLALIWAMPAQAYRQTDTTNRMLLDTLDVYLQNVEHYDALKRQEITQLKKEILSRPATERATLYGRIGDCYAAFDIDSAQHYYDLGINIAQINGDRVAINRLQLARIRTMPYQGLVHEAIRDLNRMDVSRMLLQTRAEYFYTMHVVYLNATKLHPADSVMQRYMNISLQAADSMLVYAGANNRRRQTIETWLSLYPHSNNYDPDAGARLRQGADTIRPLSPSAPQMAKVISYLANAETDTATLVRYLTIASIIDVANSNYLSTNLHNLGKILYKQGDVKRAYRYLITALDRALQSGATMLTLEAAETLPAAIDTATRRGDRNDDLYLIIVLILAVLSIVLILQLIYVHRHRRRLIKYQEKLANANRAKDYYTRKLLDIYGANIDNVTNFNRLVERKVKAHQTQDLLQLAESGNVVQKQLQEFNETFDRAFMEVHPSFIRKLNRLLVADEQFEKMPDGILNGELRMIALMALGVAEPSQLSKFLGLSINTVYTYRNRLRNRAIDRKNFEKNLAALVEMV